MNLHENLHPLLTPDRIKILKQFNIKRLNQLLSRSPEHLARILKISYTQAVDLTEALFRTFSVFPVTAIDVYRLQLKIEKTFDCGAPVLDKLVRQFKTGFVYEVFGYPGSGKSQLCMSLSVESALKHPDVEIFYLDTKGDLVPQRVLQMLQEKSETGTSVSVLSKIKVLKIFKLEDFTNALRDICRIAIGPNIPPVARLLLIDNLVSPIMGMVSSDINLAFSYSSQIQQMLQQLAGVGACVVCTNHSRTFEGKEKPALGTIWTQLADIRVRVDHLEGQQRRFTVIKGFKQEVSCDVIIGKSGLSDNKVN